MKKVLSIAFVVLILAALFVPAVSAQSKWDYLLIDSADILDESEEANVLSALSEVSKKHNYDVAVLTLNDYSIDFGTNFSDIKDAALYYCQRYLNEGCVLFMVSMQERDWAIQTNPDGRKVFTVYGREYIGAEVNEALHDGDYEDAFTQYAELADEFLEEAKKGTPYDDNHKRLNPFDVFLSIAIPLAVGLVIAFVVMSSIRKKYKPVRLKAEANDYLVPDSLQVKQSYDRFIYTHITRTRKAKSSSGGGISSNSSGGTSGKF